ncbi:SLC13 family permease [bacterium]|nr:SLC13 family permease [bacterium]
MTLEIALVLALLGLVVVLFVTEALRVDVIALIIMVALPWLGLISPEQAFSGLASDAVVAIIAVMILSHGLDRAGVMTRVTRPILRLAGDDARKITALVSLAAATVSSVMQNMGSAALLLPAILRISRRTGIPAGRLLLPMGYVAILGGTLTLVASGPLIILNDLLQQAGAEPFGLFAPTPIGLALVATGVVYFLALGSRVLPRRTTRTEDTSMLQQELIETWRLPATRRHCRVPAGSDLVGMTLEQADLWGRYALNLLALEQDGDVVDAPWRHTRFAPGQRLTLLGEYDDVDRFVEDHDLEGMDERPDHDRADGPVFAEVVVPPRSPHLGRTIRQLALRREHGVEPVILLSGREERREDVSDVPLRAGDVIVAYGPRENLRAMGSSRGFALISPVDAPDAPRARPLVTVLCAGGAVVAILAGAHLAVALLSGAVAMVLLKLVPIDEAYGAIDWRTVFLLAGLIPLGVALDETGGARYLAGGLMSLPHGGQPLVVMAGLALLASLFSLFLSNVAATVLLVPLVLEIGESLGIPGRSLGLLVAISTANSFLLPTHQVNALLMGPGGYRNRDYLRAGALLTILVAAVVVGLTRVLYL